MSRNYLEEDVDELDRLAEAAKSVHVYAMGLCAASVCAPKDMPPREVVRHTNYNRPTGIDSKWELSGDKTFKGGQPNPCVCEQSADRLHYLMVC